ncbi:MAG: hypothetical protein ABIF77_02150 [bacterium]
MLTELSSAPHGEQPARGPGIADGTNGWSVRRILCFALFLLMVCPGQGGAEPTDDQARRFQAIYIAPVRFLWEDLAAETASVRCREVWVQQRQTVLETLLPAIHQPDSIDCFLLPTALFQSHFLGELPDWGVGVALSGGRVIALDYQRIPGIGRSVEEVFLHEMTHALLMQSTGQTWLPTWFHEGVAMWVAGEWRFVDTVQVMMNGTVPDLWRLEGRFPRHAVWADQAYRTSLLAVESLRRWYGEDVLQRLIAATAASGDFELSFHDVTGVSDEQFARRFAGAMKVRFGWLITMTRWPTLFVLMALLFVAGALRRLINNRRRLAEMEDELPPTSPH